MKYLYWELRNSIDATQIHPSTKNVLPLMNFKQNVTHRPTSSFSTKIQFQIVAKCAHNNYLQASTLKTPLFSRKLHVKTTLHAKR